MLCPADVCADCVVGVAHRRSYPNKKLPTFASASICLCSDNNKKAVGNYGQRHSTEPILDI